VSVLALVAWGCGGCVHCCCCCSATSRLTEEDTEYVIHAIKHIFPEHLVFQFDCTNTIREQLLQNVTVTMDLAEAVGGGVRGTGVLWDEARGPVMAMTQSCRSVAEVFCSRQHHRVTVRPGHLAVRGSQRRTVLLRSLRAVWQD